jgi:hypothetical protein
MVAPISRVHRLPGCSVYDYFLQWIQEVVCPCEYARTSIEVKMMHPKCHYLSKVGDVAAAGNNQYVVLFAIGVQNALYRVGN